MPPVRFFFLLAANNCLECRFRYACKCSRNFFLLDDLLTLNISRSPPWCSIPDPDFFFGILWGTKHPILSNTISISPPCNYNFLPILRIYPREKSVNLKHLICGTPGLIFPLVSHGKFLSIKLRIMHRNGHWSPAQCYRRQASFRAGQGQHLATHNINLSTKARFPLDPSAFPFQSAWGKLK